MKEEKEEMRSIKSLLILTNEVVISEIEEVVSEIGEPDCKLINPCTIAPITGEFIPWLADTTDQKVLMISSDKIITLVDPKPRLLRQYIKMFP